MEEHLVARDTEGRLQKLVLRILFEFGVISTADFLDCLLTDHQMLHKILGWSRIEDVVRVDLEEGDDFFEDVTVTLLMRVIFELFLVQAEDIIVESAYFDNRGEEETGLITRE